MVVAARGRTAHARLTPGLNQTSWEQSTTSTIAANTADPVRGGASRATGAELVSGCSKESTKDSGREPLFPHPRCR